VRPLSERWQRRGGESEVCKTGRDAASGDSAGPAAAGRDRTACRLAGLSVMKSFRFVDDERRVCLNDANVDYVISSSLVAAFTKSCIVLRRILQQASLCCRYLM